MRIIGTILAGAALLIAGCSGSKQAETGTKNMAAGQMKGGAQCAMMNQGGTLSGVVKETLNAAGYTYARVSGPGGDMWAAAPQCSLSVGDTVSFSNGMPMKDFKSTKLNRTFPLVYFTEGFGRGTPVAGAACSMQKPMGAPHGMINQANPVGDTMSYSSIKKPAGGSSVADLYAGKKTLVGQKVVVRGRVVKSNDAIMGKNWLHLRDGTGEKGSNDLTITTDAKASVGQTVLVEGVLTADKNIGSGYVFPLVLENAKLTVEK